LNILELKLLICACEALCVCRDVCVARIEKNVSTVDPTVTCTAVLSHTCQQMATHHTLMTYGRRHHGSIITTKLLCHQVMQENLNIIIAS